MCEEGEKVRNKLIAKTIHEICLFNVWFITIISLKISYLRNKLKT
tara:strand:+ start:1102 stop:1236 length:135 start_codon:yes stop_codon:yes gene_type:complete